MATAKHFRRNNNQLRNEIRRIVLNDGNLESCYTQMPDESRKRIAKEFNYLKMHDYAIQQYMSAKVSQILREDDSSSKILETYKEKEPEKTEEDIFNNIVIPEDISSNIPEDESAVEVAEESSKQPEVVQLQVKEVISHRNRFSGDTSRMLNENKKDIIDKYLNGDAFVKIAKDYGCSDFSVRQLIYRELGEEKVKQIIASRKAAGWKNSIKKVTPVVLNEPVNNKEKKLFKFELANSNMVRAGLISKRHNMPVNQYIYSSVNDNKIVDFEWLEDIAEIWMKTNLGYNESTGKYSKGLILYVTGLASACSSVIKLCYKNNIPLILMHYSEHDDDDNPIYHPQFMNTEQRDIMIFDAKMNALFIKYEYNVHIYNCTDKEILNSNGNFYLLDIQKSNGKQCALALSYEDIMRCFSDVSISIHNEDANLCELNVYEYKDWQHTRVMQIKM